MKLQLDYDNKIISLDSNANLRELVDRLQQILPDWEDWKINTSINNWRNPIIIREYPSKPWWEYQSYSELLYNHTPHNYQIDDTNITGVHNIELTS